MIDIHIVEESAAKAVSQLRELLSAEPQQGDTEQKPERPMDEADLMAVLAEKDAVIASLELQITEITEEAKNKVAGYEELLKVKDERIADLEKQLADAGTAKSKKAKKAPEPEPEADEPTPAEPEETEPAPEPAKEYKKEDVRAVLVNARECGINIADILANYGGSLGAVKTEDYPALVKEAQDAIAAAGGK
jgi:hypothetical protein